MQDDPRCKHRGCNCVLSAERVAKNQPFCSDFCAEHDKVPRGKDGSCGCGHPHCSEHHHA
jgi:hypothetical protein